jgi:hypothetical protein
MIISILSDSYDEFQVFAIYCDCREMTEVILEIEQMFSISTRINKDMFFQVCVNYYKEEDDNWQGKVLDTRVELIKNRAMIKLNCEKIERFEEKIDTKIREVEEKIESDIRGVEDSIKQVYTRLEEIHTLLNK